MFFHIRAMLLGIVAGCCILCPSHSVAAFVVRLYLHAIMNGDVPDAFSAQPPSSVAACFLYQVPG